jgi:heptosyltransferase-2
LSTDPKNILVIRGGAVGDFIVALPAIHALRERWPGARIECLGYPRTTALGAGRFYFDGIRSLERGTLAGFFVTRPGAILDPEWMDYFGDFDLVVSWLYDPDEAFAKNVRRCGVPELWARSPQIEKGFGAPAARHFLDTLLFDTAQADLRSRLFPSEADRTVAASFYDGPKFIALHPGSGSPTKNWPVANWAQVIPRLPLPVVLVGGEADGPALEALAPLAAGVVREKPLPELAAFLGRAALFLGHDSGITHLAAAAGAPVVAIFGPTDPTVWAPPGPGATVLRGGAGWRGPTVERVVEAALARIDKSTSPR